MSTSRTRSGAFPTPPRPTASAARPRPRTPARGPQPYGGPLQGTRAARRKRSNLRGPRSGQRRPHGPFPGPRRRLHAPVRAQRHQIQRRCQSAPLQPVQQPRELLRAARGHQQPHPVVPYGHRRVRAQPPQRRRSRLDRHVQDVEAQAGDEPQWLPGHRAPPQFVLVPVPLSVVRIEWAAGERDRGARGDCANHAKSNRSSGPGVTLGGPAIALGAGKGGVRGAATDARLFARSGGNRGTWHGVSVRTGKTSLVGGGDTQKRASHVRHRRTHGEGNCLACGNIVSHHQVGADVGVRVQEAVLDLGPVSAVGMSGPRLRD